jgi:hypothetical protein
MGKCAEIVAIVLEKQILVYIAGLNLICSNPYHDAVFVDGHLTEIPNGMRNGQRFLSKRHRAQPLDTGDDPGTRSQLDNVVIVPSSCPSAATTATK